MTKSQFDRPGLTIAEVVSRWPYTSMAYSSQIDNIAERSK